MRVARFGVLAGCLALAACFALEGEKIDYKSAGRSVTLDVPPDLSQLARDSRYQLPGGTVTASGFQGSAPAPGVPVASQTAAAALGDVRVERQGNQRWLVVNRPAEQLYGPVRDFWQESGFLLTLDEASLGIMETDWAENRAKLPQDFIRNTLGRLLDSVYSTSERDRFRTRLERTAGGGTEILISHRGMQEIYSPVAKDQTIWQPRPADAELEAEFLRRLMLKLGAPQAQARTVTATGQPVRATSRITQLGSVSLLQIDDGFDRAWRRVGLSLDRTGFTVEDRDRSQGTYFVRYVAPNPDRKEPGILGRLFSRERNDAPLKYRITLRSQGEATTVSVLDAQGAPETSANAQRIVQVLADDLK